MRENEGPLALRCLSGPPHRVDGISLGPKPVNPTLNR